jgi:hypothetical protein
MKKAKALNGKVKVLPGQLKLEDKKMDFSKVGKKPTEEKAKPPAPAAPWLKGCEICNAGLCNEMDHLTAPLDKGGLGLSEREAARRMEEIAQKAIGIKVWAAEQIRKRYERHAGGASRQAGTKRPTQKPKPAPAPVDVVAVKAKSPEQAPDPELLGEYRWSRAIDLLADVGDLINTGAFYKPSEETQKMFEENLKAVTRTYTNTLA